MPSSDWDPDRTGKIYISRVPSSATPPRNRLTLVVLEGPEPGKLLTVDAEELVLGRGGSTEARFGDGGVSRRHARVFRRDDVWYIEDLGSTNGTWVAGSELRQPRQLREGDRIQMGSSILLKVTLHDETEQETVRRLYESAVRDPLTRVFNRRYLEERLVAEFAYALRHRTPLSVLVLDVDRFKRINDTLGHPAGDAVLRVLGGTLQRMVRAEDVVARWGGEEFVIVARGIDGRNAMIFAERVRKLVAGLTIPWDRPIHVTVSVGVATFSRTRPFGDSVELLEAADRALYRAKNEGRDRCVLA